MRNILLVVFSLLALSLAGCKMTGTAATPQSVVDAAASANTDVTRLTLHCMQPDGTCKTCASTDAARVGKASDPEDTKAMQTGETIVLEEGEAIDVTVPILQKDGKWMTVCGVTLKKNGMTKEQAIAKATTIANAVKADLGDCCAKGCDCCK